MKHFILVAALSATLPLVASARGNPQRPPGGRGGRRAMSTQQQPGDSVGRNRAMLEHQVQRRLEQMMQRRLGATDAQMAKVRDINMKYADKRRLLLDQERDIRIALREEVIGADSSHQAHVAELLDRMLSAQRQRIEVLEQEQHDLAGVLTPLQRATYIGLEEQLRQRLENMRAQGGRGGPGGPGDPNGPPPNGARGRRGPPGGVAPDVIMPPRRPPGLGTPNSTP